MYFYLLTLLQWHFISAALTETLLLQSRKGQQKQHCHKSTSGRATKLHSDLLPICRNSAYDSVAKMHPLLAGVLKKCCGGMSKLPNIQIAVVAKLDIMARWSRWQNPALTCYYVSMAAVLSFASAEVAGPGSEGSTCVGISLREDTSALFTAMPCQQSQPSLQTVLLPFPHFRLYSFGLSPAPLPDGSTSRLRCCCSATRQDDFDKVFDSLAAGWF